MKANQKQVWEPIDPNEIAYTDAPAWEIAIVWVLILFPFAASIAKALFF